jgi:hypothetical protein
MGLFLVLPKWTLISVAIACSLAAGYSAFAIGPPLVGRNIKGNVSYTPGERIYHVSGQKYYSATRIRLLQRLLAPRDKVAVVAGLRIEALASGERPLGNCSYRRANAGPVQGFWKD